MAAEKETTILGYNSFVKHVSVILVHYNNTKTTNSCLSSLSSLIHPEYACQYIIVDNGSIKKYVLPKSLTKSKKFKVIRSDANLGFTGGNNLGIHYAVERNNSQFIFLLNNDTTIHKQALRNLLQTLEDQPEVGIICPKIYFSAGKEYHSKSYLPSERGKVFWYAGGSIDWQHIVAFHRGVDEVDRGQFNNAAASDFATGCAMLIRREVLEKVGFLDKRYFMYFEDVDLSLRAKKAGYSIAFCPNAIVWHDNAGSSGGSGSSLHVYYQERNRYLLAFAHGTPAVIPVVLRLQFQALTSGSRLRRKAVLDFYKGSFGKQSLV